MLFTGSVDSLVIATDLEKMVPISYNMIWDEKEVTAKAEVVDSQPKSVSSKSDKHQTSSTYRVKTPCCVFAMACNAPCENFLAVGGQSRNLNLMDSRSLQTFAKIKHAQNISHIESKGY